MGSQGDKAERRLLDYLQSTPETKPGVPEPKSGGLLNRTLRNLRGAWRDIASNAFGVVTPPRPNLPDDDAQRLREQMQDCLAHKGGEVSARARAAALGRDYLSLDGTGRARFLRLLASEFDVDPAKVEAASDALREAVEPAEKQKAMRELRAALEAPRLRLLTQFNALPEGVKFLVDLRAQLQEIAMGEPALEALNHDLRGLLASWFDIGFLELRRITWNSPASLLEKLSEYEAVHEIRSWDDLKNRLDTDRRCFAFFHPRMPDEPLIFVQVALVVGMAGSVHVLLDEGAPVQDPNKADTAIFYSISNAQKGLVGISFGNFLIKRVVDSLSHEFPNLKTFATLSPIPGFRAWLDKQLDAGQEEALLSQVERRALAAVAPRGEDSVLRGVLRQPDWYQTDATIEAIRKPLMRLGARYLSSERRRNGAMLDPVAHFHLSNGARMERLNWLADTSPKGLQQSAGMMINYLYKLGDIEVNLEAYTGEGKVAMSSAMRALRKE